MIPFKDDQPRYSAPVINYLLIGTNLIVFLLEQGMTKGELDQLALVPAHLWAPHATVAQVITPFFTSMFLHAGWAHVLGNMLFLFIFGDNVEDYLGHFKYLVFYLLSGLFAAATQVAFSAHSRIPMVGASGAIAGVLGAYFMLYPRSRVLTWLPPIFFFHLPAWIVLGYWFVLQFLMGAETLSMTRTRDMGGVAVWAHVGGFVSGLVMVKIFPERARRYPYAYR
jgi:membrane associated rhomboid family serine protease